MDTHTPTLEDVKAAIRRHREGFAALAARRPGDGQRSEDAAVLAFDLALACFDNPYGVHGTSKKLVADLVPGDHVLVLDRGDSEQLVWRTVSDGGITTEADSLGGFVRVHFVDGKHLDLDSADGAVTVDAATAYRNVFEYRQGVHVAEGLVAVQKAMETPRPAVCEVCGAVTDGEAWCPRCEADERANMNTAGIRVL